MPYRILSLYFGHDANICLLEDGHPVLVLEKERVTRIKHDQGHMQGIVSQRLRAMDWPLESIDMIVINPNATMAIVNITRGVVGPTPSSLM